MAITQASKDRIDALNADELARLLGLDPADQTNNKPELHHARIRFARLGCYSWKHDSDTVLQWCARLGHPGFRQVAAFLRRNQPEIKLDGLQAVWCEACVKAKTQRQKFRQSTPKVATQDQDPLTRFDGDVMGPFPPSKDGMRHAVVFISERDTVYCYFLPHLRDFDRTQRQFMVDVRRDLSNTPHNGEIAVSTPHVHTDGASYFSSEKARATWAELGCTLSISKPHTPQSNGRAEALIKTLKRRALASMVAAGVKDKRLWPEAISMAVHAYDCVGSARHNYVSPYEMRCGKKPDLTTLRTPFSTCIVWRPVAGRDASGTPGRRGIYMGWCRLTDSAKVLLQGDMRTSTCKAHHIRFDPTLSDLSRNQWFVYKANAPSFDHRHTMADDPDDVINIDDMRQEHAADNDTINVDGSVVANIELSDSPPDTTHLNLVADKLTEEDREFMRRLHSNNVDTEVLYNYTVAKRSKHGALVDAATDKELRGLASSGCLVQVDSQHMPAGAETLRVVTVFCPKYNNDKNRTLQKYKTRVCIDGRSFKQKHANETDEFFRRDTGQPNVATWRVHYALQVANRNDDGTFTPTDDSEHVHVSTDVSQAYLNAEFNPPKGVDIYIKLPRDLERRAIEIGMAKPDDNGVRFALRKAGYGLPASARLWENCFIDHMTKGMGCIHSKWERCLFYSPTGHTRILCHTDDCHMIGPKQEVETLVAQMEAKWGKMTINKWPDTMLGWTLSYSSDKAVAISAVSHITKLRKQCEMTNRFPRYTPMRGGVRFSKADRSPTDVGVTKTTQKLSGILNYIAMIARPDCSFTASQFGILASSPKRTVVPELRHAARYLDATSHFQNPVQKEHGRRPQHHACILRRV